MASTRSENYYNHSDLTIKSDTKKLSGAFFQKIQEVPPKLHQKYTADNFWIENDTPPPPSKHFNHWTAIAILTMFKKSIEAIACNVFPL